MSRSKKTAIYDTTFAAAFRAAGITLPKKETKKKFEWAAKAKPQEKPARTTSSTLARTVVCGKKETGHPDGLLDLNEQCKLLMQDIMDGLK